MFNIETTSAISCSTPPSAISIPTLGPSGDILSSPSQPVPLALYSPSVNNLNNNIYGSSKGETLVGTDKNNIIKARAGHDEVLGGAGHDQLFGGRGHDYLNGGAGRDRLVGGRGHDQLVGGSGHDLLLGQRGHDRLFGQAGNDRLYGHRGHDELNGGTGRDQLFGGRGRDRLVDYDGGDWLTGGGGKDEFWIGEGTLGVTRIEDFEMGRDRLKFMPLGITYEQLTFQQKGFDTVISFDAKALARLKNTYANELQSNSFEFGDVSLIPQLQAALATSEAPGAALHVTTADGSIWRGARGEANIENNVPMPVDARVGIASITKSITAVTTLQLVQEGKLNLDDTLSHWLPQLTDTINNSETITLRQLLNHTSGLLDLPNEEFADVLLDNIDRVWTPEDFLTLQYDLSESFSPGAQHGYSNTNYTLLGLVIEAATGDTLAGQMQARIFDPLGMDDSFVISAESTSDDFVSGYMDLADYGLAEVSQTTPVPFHPTAQGFGEGGVIATVADLARFSEALNNGELLTPQTFERMKRESVPDSDMSRYGLGIELVQSPFGKLIGHTGGFPGSDSTLYSILEQGITVATLENKSGTSGNVLIESFNALFSAT